MTRRLALTRKLLNLIAAATILAASGATELRAASSLADILSQWKSRQKVVRTVIIEWNEQKLSLEEQQDGRGNSQTPPVDRCQMNKRVCIMGTMLRYYFEDVATGRTFDGAWNGKFTKTLHSPFEKRKYPVGYMSRDATSPDVYVMHTRPIRLAFRPLETKMKGFASEELELLPEHGRIEGHDCAILSVRHSGSPMSIRLWAAADLGYSILRCTYSIRGTLRRQIDISYGKHPIAQWTPIRWRITQYGGNGKTTLTTNASVTKCEINAKLSPRDFDVSFPVGTLVTDVCNKKQIRNYIVQANKHERVITKHEQLSGLSYEQLLHNEQASAMGTRYMAWRWLALIAACGVVVITGIVFVLRRSRNHV